MLEIMNITTQIQHNATQYITTQHNSHYNTTQDNTTQYNTIQHNTIQHNTILHSTAEQIKMLHASLLQDLSQGVSHKVIYIYRR
jgi:uncharacterized FlaG/YvyC family protein